MRTTLAATFALLLVGAPAVARADLGGCLAGPNDQAPCSVSGTPAALLGAIAAPVLIAGAAVSIADELRRKTEERAPDGSAVAPAARRGRAPSLALVPDPPDPYRARASNKEARKPPNAAFRFNEAATNVTTVVAGAMVLGAVVATIVQGAHK